MGGKIDVYSEKGKGSAFVVTVPLKTAKEDRRRTERTTYQEYDFPGKGHCLSKIMKSILKLQETF